MIRVAANTADRVCEKLVADPGGSHPNFDPRKKWHVLGRPWAYTMVLPARDAQRHCLGAGTTFRTISSLLCQATWKAFLDLKKAATHVLRFLQGEAN